MEEHKTGDWPLTLAGWGTLATNFGVVREAQKNDYHAQLPNSEVFSNLKHP